MRLYLLGMTGKIHQWQCNNMDTQLDWHALFAMLCYGILLCPVCKALVEESSSSPLENPLYMVIFSLLLSNFVWIDNLIVMYLSVDIFKFILFRTLGILDFCLQIWIIFNYCFFDWAFSFQLSPYYKVYIGWPTWLYLRSPLRFHHIFHHFL